MDFRTSLLMATTLHHKQEHSSSVAAITSVAAKVVDRPSGWHSYRATNYREKRIIR